MQDLKVLVDQGYGLNQLEFPNDGQKDRSNNSKLFAVLNDQVIPLLERAVHLHHRSLFKNALTILVEQKPAPIKGVRDDGPVRCFVASGPWLSVLLQMPLTLPADLCYLALTVAVSDRSLSVNINVIHRPSTHSFRPDVENVDVIIPHLGNDDHLLACVSSLIPQTMPNKVVVCFDQPPNPTTLECLHSLRHFRVFCASPQPSGPYVIRQHFGLRSASEFISFQDSDDFSLPGRFGLLAAHAREGSVDIVGTHELRLDELDNVVVAVRFPLDVTAALAISASHPQLFPTTIIRGEFFKAYGGLSTIRSFGSDTEFLLRSHFYGRITNVDEFMYVRRKRHGSLTTVASTALGSPVRVELDRKWKEDFESIKARRLSVEGSSLAIEPSPIEHSFRQLVLGDTEDGKSQ